MRTVLLMLATGLIACGSDNSSTSSDVADDGIQQSDGGAPAADGPDDTESDSTPGVVDLTNQLLSSTDPNCGSYVGSYTSMITDVATGQQLEGMFTISATGSTCRFETNQIPNHDTGEGSRFQGAISANNAVLEVTTSPASAGSPSALGMGASAILLNGVKWEAYPAACYGVGNEPAGREAIGCGPDQLGNPWRYNIGSSLNDFGFDTHLAHLQPGGLYHYHSTPSVLYDIECEGTAVSPVIGFAADGFPVYGPCFRDDGGTIRAARSGYVLRSGERQAVTGYTTPRKVGNVAGTTYDGQFIGDHEWVAGAGDLDACNGMIVDGQYGYYVTGSYPYVLACYTGTPSRNFR